MAAASSRLPALFLLFCLYYFSMSSTHVRFAGSLSFDINFTHPSASSPSANLHELIVCAGDAFISPSTLELTKAMRGQNDTNSTGRASYAQKVPLWDNATGEMASFTTTFSFEITPSTSQVTADGMAFFLAHFPSEIPADSAGRSLGLLPLSGSAASLKDEQHFVAVEFDTYLNVRNDDPSSNHIGIDVNSVNSTASSDTTSPSRNLTSGFRMVANVTFDNRTRFLAVDLQIDDTMYHVNATVDPRRILPEEVAVGFSAATGANAELHRVMSWSFSSTLEPKKPAMAPQPATHPIDPLLPPPLSKHPSKVGILLSVLVPLFFLFVCAVLGFLLWRRRIRISESDSEEQHERAELERRITANGPRRYTYRELATATNNFAQEAKLGQGGFGSVYRGQLTVDGQDRPVAIKVLSPDSSAQGRKEFEAEVRIISQLKHRNLVHLLGWCDSRKGLLLVYELVSEGSLDKHLYNSERLLTWPERYQIILGLGSSLRYLHGEWEQCVLHGDIKPSNIMLDSSYMTKLGDFGLARLVDHGTLWKTTHTVLGTAGYIDPEFVNTGRPSTESDVYSFGIVLLEIVSGRRPVVETSDGIFTLLRWVWNLYGRNAIVDATDKRLSGNEQEMERVLVIGLWCAHPDPRERPSVAHAMHILQTKDAKLPTPPLKMYTALSDPTVAAYGAFSTDSSSGTVTSSTTTGNTVLSFDSPSSALLGNSKDRA